MSDIVIVSSESKISEIITKSVNLEIRRLFPERKFRKNSKIVIKNWQKFRKEKENKSWLNGEVYEFLKNQNCVDLIQLLDDLL